MTDLALAPAAAAPRTWRDAITPESRASRRRWTLAYALLLCLAVLCFGFDLPPENGSGVLVVAALFVVFGMLRRGTRRLTAIDHPGLDERDMLARDRAFRLAYPLLLVVLLAALAILAFGLPEVQRTVVQGTSEVITPGNVLDGKTLTGLALWVGLWAIYLPTGVLAWREPDGLEPDPGEPERGMSEVTRDVLLGGALFAGLLIGQRSHSDPLSVLPLVAVPMALGAVARRAAGQPPVQAETVWRLLACLVLAAVILAALFFSVGEGS